MPTWNEYKATAKERGALALELFVVQTTPSGDPETVRITLPAHLAYQRQLEVEGSLVLAGPVSDPSGEQMEGAGQIIYRAPSMEAAKVLAENDPMHVSGARTYTLCKWLVNEGSLNFGLGLSTGRVNMQ